MATEERWYQKFRCRNCGSEFTQFPALLGYVLSHGVELLQTPYRPTTRIDFNERYKDFPTEAKESISWVRTHALCLCSDNENGIADLIGFTTEAPQVKEGGLRELLGDEIPEHLRML